ncbi:hypothetical protein Tco_1578004 [Tanacetum coccineum]
MPVVTANPLALVAAAQQYPDLYYQAPKSPKSFAPTSKQSSFTRSHETTRHKDKEIAKPITPPSESASEEDNDPEQAQKDKEMHKNLALIAKYKNDNQTGQFRNHRTVTVVGARETIGKQADRIEDTNEEIDEHELEAHYNYMEKIQEVPNADSGPDAEPLEKVQYNDEYNVSANDRQHFEQPESINNTCVMEKAKESIKNNTTAKLPILKLENGNSWVSVPQTTQENGVLVIKMSVPATTEEKTNKKNDVKARSLLLMALPNEHQLTFSQYNYAKAMFAAIKIRFGGNEATKKNQKTLLKQQYENFSASSTESLDSIFNRLQKIVSRLAILVWMNKANIETISIDDLYNNFKIVEQDVKKSVGTSTGAQNMAFMTAPSTSSTNDVNTANTAYEVSIVSYRWCWF